MTKSTKVGAAPKTAPVGWVFLDRHRHDGYTIRWRRGGKLAYVLNGNRVGDHGMSEVLDTILAREPRKRFAWSGRTEHH